MANDKYKTCLGCPDRAVGCRATCDGWQAREAEKQIRYDLHLHMHASIPDHAGYKKILNRRMRKAQMKGSGKL